MSAVRQAIILVGGRATRLQKGGVAVPVSKSFLLLGGKPLLFWNLYLLHLAGIRSVVLAGNEVRHIYHAKKVVAQLPFRFDQVHSFHDFGFGVHGLPFYASHSLDETFLFDCGHSLSSPTHYQALMAAKRPDTVVFSAFATHPTNPRLPVVLGSDTVQVAPAGSSARHALAHPILADHAYARSLVWHDFNITSVISEYATKGQIRYVVSDLPPEFDTIEEMTLAKTVYEQYLTTTGLL